MYDAVLLFGDLAMAKSSILQRLEVSKGDYLLLTIHRAYNTDNPAVLASIFSALSRVQETVIFPAHPRTKIALMTGQVPVSSNVMMIDPIGYLDTLMLEKNSRMILTDSGGMQKEAYFFSIPCLTLRPETEWVETTVNGWNKLVGSNSDTIVEAIKSFQVPKVSPVPVFGNGHASELLVKFLSC